MGLNLSPSGETLRLFVLLKAYWGRDFWARGYFVASSGNVTGEVIQEYIRQQEDIESDDGGGNFRVTKS
jgi:putative transposase